MFFPVRTLLSIVVLALLAGPLVARDDRIAGPVAADILRVVDGDTLLVEAMPWPQQRVEVYVRLRGIDTPELNASCPALRARAEAARQALIDMAGETGTVWLRNIGGDKYFGRIVADVTFADGRDPAQDLQAAGLAVAYHGGRKPAIDCAATAALE